MNRPFDTRHYTQLINAEQRAYEVYVNARKALESKAGSDSTKSTDVKGQDRLKATAQVWHEAHFRRVAYEN